jgi:ssDNA-binding replication factor A large subunit
MSDEPTGEDRVRSRAELLPEEKVAGSDDPAAQAEAILDESEERTLERDGTEGAEVEHRTSEDTTPPHTA